MDKTTRYNRTAATLKKNQGTKKAEMALLFHLGLSLTDFCFKEIKQIVCLLCLGFSACSLR
jgi:hypothetical protein